MVGSKTIRIEPVAAIARNQMHVQVLDDLARRRAIADFDVEPIRLKFGHQRRAGFRQQLTQLDPFHDGQTEQRDDVPARDEQGVSRRRRSGRADRHHVRSLTNDPLRWQEAIGAGITGHDDTFGGG